MKLSPRGVQAPLEALDKLRLPAILHWDMNHFVVLTGPTAEGSPCSTRRAASGCCRGRGVAPLHRRGDGAHAGRGLRRQDERERITAGSCSPPPAAWRPIAQVLLLSLALEVFAVTARSSCNW